MVKRRSARLQKRTSASPSAEGDTSNTPVADRFKDLPSVNELPEPTSQLPIPSAAAPQSSRKPQTSLKGSATPQHATPIKPASWEMHPSHHQHSTTKPLDEARWLGFHAKGMYTAPPKMSRNIGIAQATPTKTKPMTPTLFSSPDFHFRFKSPAAALSPAANRILGEGVQEDEAKTPHTFAKNPFTTPADLAKRKIAVPKGKSTRFSDVHAAQFKKMDSIANHSSMLRADPNRFKFNTPLKRSPSKAELDKAEAPAPAPAPRSLKRTQSKMDITRGNTSLPRSKSTIKMVSPAKEDRPSSRDEQAAGPSKRVKRKETDDTSTNRPLSRDNKQETAPQTAISRLNSRLFTPTKASLARSQSVKVTKSASMIPSMLRSPSMGNLASPKAVKQSITEGIRKTSATLHVPSVKSILRTPSRKFSNDPTKIAAGTHMSPPQSLNFARPLPPIPATAPAAKHVNFTHSTIERAEQHETVGTPSPTKVRASSEVPVSYPALPDGSDPPLGSPSRRLTFGGVSRNMPGSFTFESDKQANFVSTIRPVRSSDVNELPESSKKRKLESIGEGSDKENQAQEEDVARAAKRSKANPVSETPKTPASKLPRRLPKRPSSLSKARLNFLATPKRNKA